MQINLSDEMIYKITCVSFGRLQALREKEDAVKNSIAVGKRQIARKHILLNDIEKAKADAEDVRALFLGLLRELEGDGLTIEDMRRELSINGYKDVDEMTDYMVIDAWQSL